LKKYTVEFRLSDTKAKPVVFDNVTSFKVSTRSLTGPPNVKEVTNEQIAQHMFTLTSSVTYHFYSDSGTIGTFSAKETIAVNVNECENIPPDFFDEVNNL